MNGPFLKWAGGKRWLTSLKEPLFPDRFSRYIEPFLGGGAVFFHMNPSAAILSDINQEIIDLYHTIRDNPESMQIKLQEHQDKHSRQYYYEIRENVPDDTISRAARTIYLNRTCWNGLYRVNLKGKFNVPIGTKNKIFYNNDEFVNYSKTLSGVEIRCSDFEETLSEATHNDFVFIDPPYTVKHNNNGFVKYNESIFSWSDQERLKLAAEKAAGRGAKILITNADHDSIRELYGSSFAYRNISRSSVISGSPTARGQTTEAIFTANL